MPLDNPRPARRSAATTRSSHPGAAYEPTLCEALEARDVLSGVEFLPTGSQFFTQEALFTTNADPGFFDLPVDAQCPGADNAGTFGNGASDNGHTVMHLNDFQADTRFTQYTGRNFTSVILDTGINPNSSFFGPDNDHNGVPDRIVYQYDFADGRADASDPNGHGSNVASAIGSANSTYSGIAPDANLIALRVFNDAGQGSFTWLEQSLQWVIGHAAQYNIASVNMSLGDSQNWSTRTSMYGIGDELSTLAQMGVIVVAAAGNSFFNFNGALGMAYPAADPNVISVGAVYGQTGGGFSYGGGAAASTSPAGAIAPFSQRSGLLDVFAPGAPIVGAGTGSTTVTMHGTSQASPQIAGVALLAQQMATDLLGRRLSMSEFRQMLVSTGTTIFDGDDENDNVTNTNANYPLVNVQALANAIWAMRPVGAPAPATNHAPTLTDVTDLTGGVVNRRAIITYDMLAQAADESDTDGDTLSFRIDAVNSGELTLNGRLVRPGVTVLGPGDSLVWQPSSGVTGLTNAFAMVVTDGRMTSAEAVSVNINVDLVVSNMGIHRSLAVVGALDAGMTDQTPDTPQQNSAEAALKSLEFVSAAPGGADLGLKLAGSDHDTHSALSIKHLMGFNSAADQLMAA